MKAKIVFYRQKGLNQNDKFKLRKELFGLEQKSNFGKYSYRVRGVLHEIPHYKPIDSAIIVEHKNLWKIRELLGKHHSDYEIFTIDVQKGKLVNK